MPFTTTRSNETLPAEQGLPPLTISAGFDYPVLSNDRTILARGNYSQDGGFRDHSPVWIIQTKCFTKENKGWERFMKLFWFQFGKGNFMYEPADYDVELPTKEREGVFSYLPLQILKDLATKKLLNGQTVLERATKMKPLFAKPGDSVLFPEKEDYDRFLELIEERTSMEGKIARELGLKKSYTVFDLHEARLVQGKSEKAAKVQAQEDQRLQDAAARVLGNQNTRTAENPMNLSDLSEEEKRMLADEAMVADNLEANLNPLTFKDGTHIDDFDNGLLDEDQDLDI